jgi:hypothetical protein
MRPNEANRTAGRAEFSTPGGMGRAEFKPARTNKTVMTTQALAQTIHLRHELPLEDLLSLLPQFPSEAAHAATASRSEADHAFWTTFTFGSVQAAVLFGLIYAYFAL